MKKLTLAMLMTAFSPVAFAAPSADAILKQADAIRNPQVDYTVDVQVKSYKPNRPASLSIYHCMNKGRDKSLVETLAPAIDRGRLLLMNGPNFWGYLPSVAKPLRISLQERLTGEVANGDLARVNFSGDYTPALTAVKKINRKEVYVLELKAKTEDVTYGRAVLTIEKATARPISAEFYAFSGRLLKTCDYQSYKSLGGAVRPTVVVMRDAVNKDQYSTLEYSEMKIAPLPDKYFSKEHLKRTGP